MLAWGWAATAADAETAPIKISGENPYKAILLTPQIYNAANSDLSDLLIKDGKGDSVPYFIQAGLQNAPSDKQIYAMALINAYLKDKSFYFDYKLAVPQNADTIATSIEFATQNTNFAKTVAVYGSYDNLHWTFVQQDKLYAIDDKAKLSIVFAQPQKYTYYRFKLANNLEQISFTTVKLIYNPVTNRETYFIEKITPSFTVEHQDKRTVITIKGLKNMRLYDVTIDTDSMFKRVVSTPGGISKELYNLSLNDTAYADTTIPLNGIIAPGDTYIITIADGDDRPINIKDITVRYYADEVVFKGQTGQIYTLEFGADPAKNAPVYDIERYKDDILKGPIDRVTLGEVQSTVREATPTPWNYQLIFNIVIIIIALLLGTVILLKLRPKQR